MSGLTLGEEARRPGEARCTNCGKLVDSATSIEAEGEEKRGPREGDIAVCLGCGHVMIYAGGNGNMRDPTDEEIVEIAGDRRIVEFNTIRGPANEAFDIEERERAAARADPRQTKLRLESLPEGE